MPKGLASNLYRNGLFAGWTDYRFGSPRPVTLAKPKRIFRGDRRKHLVWKVMDILRDWRFSGFEHEGSCHHGIRSALCLQGYSWRVADAEAEALVAEAVGLLGLDRPTWEQGQPEYVEPRDLCIRCGAPIVGVNGASRAYRFCSEVCARSAREKHDFQRRSETDRVYAAAARIIKKARTKPRKCEWDP
jgi:hypothetical protein